MTETPVSTAPSVCAPLPEPCGRVYRRDGRTVVALRDEIDIATAALIGPALDGATSQDTPQLVVDLTEVSFLDCSGLNLLCRARRRALDRDGRFWLVCDCPRILRLLRAGRLHDLFRPVATPDEAFRRAAAPDDAPRAAESAAATGSRPGTEVGPAHPPSALSRAPRPAGRGSGELSLARPRTRRT
ncbi:STAS domain-containing protein [Streptomyces sp. RTGN2]|uniref:STAS domain-containing protein n=1 Tax=Streptomyces sp. RTGN2 TaxID=3016525 RepID=UPI0025574BBE|nr:STAS domain-containing protein [Streptomyces sp. RTGN2]